MVAEIMILENASEFAVSGHGIAVGRPAAVPPSSLF
jgi:hypothetical protein